VPEKVAVSLPEIVSAEEWRTARVALLAEEKALTHARDAVNTKRRMLPMVKVTEPYVFAGPGGTPASLGDLSEGRRQLIVHHSMWLDDVHRICASCSGLLDQIGHLAAS